MDFIESRMTEIKLEYESVMKQIESTSSELNRLKLRKAYLEGAFNELNELRANIDIEDPDDATAQILDLIQQHKNKIYVDIYPSMMGIATEKED